MSPAIILSVKLKKQQQQTNEALSKIPLMFLSAVILKTRVSRLLQGIFLMSLLRGCLLSHRRISKIKTRGIQQTLLSLSYYFQNTKYKKQAVKKPKISHIIHVLILIRPCVLLRTRSIHNINCHLCFR